MVSLQEDGQAAPGRLEEVRVLLNTWWIPNEERVPRDGLDDFLRVREVRAEAAALRHLRDDLRAVVEGQNGADAVLTEWIDRMKLRAYVHDGTVGFRHRGSYVEDLLAVVLSSVQEATWARLKACPDCRWVFYDRTRNASKRWCVMNPRTPGGRGCGNIAKVRRHRERKKRSTS